jgi:signal transduction histidine kinase
MEQKTRDKSREAILAADPEETTCAGGVSGELRKSSFEDILEPGRENAYDHSGGGLPQVTSTPGDQQRETEEELRRRTEELAALHAVTSALSQSIDLGQVLDLSVNKAAESSRAGLAALYLLDSSRGELQLKAARQPDVCRLPESLRLQQGGINVDALRQQRPVLCSDYGLYAGQFKSLDECLEGMALIVLPLMAKGKPVGTLALGRPKEEPFTESEQRLLESISVQIAMAIGNAQLFRSVKDMARREVELETANERLRAIDEMKNTLLANVSHELRTPLVPIGGFTRMVSDGKVGPLTDKQREFLQIVLRNVERLGQLIENLLNFSAVRRGAEAVAMQDFDLAEVIESVMREQQAAAAAKGLKVDLVIERHPLVIQGDRKRIMQVLDNLISNAIKFNREGGLVTVRAFGVGEEVEVAVEDTGRGIAEQDLPHIFERFYKGDVFSKGTGIGLALVKQILLLHGKTIWLESKLGQGSRFIFRLSRGREEEKAAGLGKTVMVVDDEPDTVEYLSTLLREEGYGVLTATSGEEALEILSRQPADLVLLDLKMPGMDGIEVCRRIKGDPKLKGINVQMVTARSDEPMIKLSYQAGADGYVVKPFDLNTFLNRLSSLLT